MPLKDAQLAELRLGSSRLKTCSYQFVHSLSTKAEPLSQLLHVLVELLELPVEVVDHLQLFVHALQDGHPAFQVLDLEEKNSLGSNTGRKQLSKNAPKMVLIPFLGFALSL